MTKDSSPIHPDTSILPGAVYVSAARFIKECLDLSTVDVRYRSIVSTLISFHGLARADNLLGVGPTFYTFLDPRPRIILAIITLAFEMTSYSL